MRCIPPFSSLNENLFFDHEGDEPWVKMTVENYKGLVRKLLYSVEVDEGWYRDRYPDVDQAIRAGAVKSAQEHFVTSGYFEGRLPNETSPVSVTAQDKQTDITCGLAGAEALSGGQLVKAEKKDLILHIGHGKTGSSFIQSVLVLNRVELERHGVLYPEHESDRMALAGKITSGNGDLILDPSFNLDPSRNVLFSNEDLFNKLLVPGVLERAVLQRGFNPRIVLYTRNVFEVLFSGWGQWIKRGGCIQDLNTFLAEDTSNLPFSKICCWLDAADKYGFDIVVRNYSNHKSDIAGDFLSNLLGASALDFDVRYPEAETVNRSLTLAEYEIQRVFNKNLVGSSSFVSDVLVDGCPEVKSSKLKCSESTYDIVVSRIKPIIDRINSRIPASERVIIEGKEAVVAEEKNSEYSISAAQIDVLVGSISRKIKMSLVENDANYLRDVAEKIVNGKDLQMEDALLLMKLAQKARPEGQYISKKVEEWTSQIATKRQV